VGDLIVMPSPKTLSRSVTGENAAILFFTGVRYQRMDEVALPAPVASKRRRSRRPKKLDALARIELRG